MGCVNKYTVYIRIIYLSICLSVCLSVHPSVHASAVGLFASIWRNVPHLIHICPILIQKGYRVTIVGITT